MITVDRFSENRRERETFAFSRRAEAGYAVQLRKIARQVGELVRGFNMDEPGFSTKVSSVLMQYSEMIKPWAKTTAMRMVHEVARRDERVWSDLSQQMGASLKSEVARAPIGLALQKYLNEQVSLITSLPVEAAERVHRLTLERLSSTGRAKEVSKEILRTAEVTASRATLIARTEVARTASGLTMVRAQHVGSKGYIWRTSRDADVRPSHRVMEGVYVDWNKPPRLQDGTVTHAGMIYNCRCHPEPVIPDDFD